MANKIIYTDKNNTSEVIEADINTTFQSSGSKYEIIVSSSKGSVQIIGDTQVVTYAATKYK